MNYLSIYISPISLLSFLDVIVSRVDVVSLLFAALVAGVLRVELAVAVVFAALVVVIVELVFFVELVLVVLVVVSFNKEQVK